jgi:hypothetical protein
VRLIRETVVPGAVDDELGEVVANVDCLDPLLS